MGNSLVHGHRRKFRDNGNVPFPDKTAAAPSASQPVPPFIYQPQIPASSTRTPKMATALPYPHVDSSLRALAAQAEGFGRSATGGLHGPIYYVTTLAGKLICAFIIFFNWDFCLVFFSFLVAMGLNHGFLCESMH